MWGLIILFVIGFGCLLWGVWPESKGYDRINAEDETTNGYGAQG